MLKQRVAVAAVGLPLLAALVAGPEPLFSVAVALVLAAAAYEFVRATAPQSGHPPALAAGALVALIAATARSAGDFRLWVLLPPLAAATALIVIRSRPPGRPALGWWVLAVLYLGALGAHWLLLRNIVDGAAWVALALAATFATDSGAYAAGRLVGRHLLVPSISPAKTWEGGAGGLVAGAAAVVAAALLTDLDVDAAPLAAIAVALPLGAIAGDLLESAIKRRAGVKDMSALLPGHGGLLDRMDSLLATGPLLYWMVEWVATS
ncbi:MAG: phosphatidate cytidylyltransferase [Dehalococcoidia bacterium]|nr:phosphatidate cytidylyltransferase [Dehalococcoidia bacterium]